MFKEAYRRQMEQIAPDPSFLQQLADRMKEENNRRSVNKRRMRLSYVYGAIGAAAVFALGIGLFFHGDSRYAGENENLIRQNAGGVPETEQSGEQIFGGSSWYGEETDPETIYRMLTEKLEGGQDVSVTVSDRTDFAEAAELSDSELTDIITLLKQGQYAGTYEEEKDILTGEPVYYLAKLADGTVVKFAIYEGEYFHCGEINGIFRLRQ